MPKLFIHSPCGTFDADARRSVAKELTDFALDCEDLPPSPFVKSAVWIYFNEYAANAVFMGEGPAATNIIAVQFYGLEGGLDESAKKRLIKGATEILGRHSGAPVRIPVFLVLHEVPEINWGIFGGNGDLAALRASPPDAPAL